MANDDDKGTSKDIIYRYLAPVVEVLKTFSIEIVTILWANFMKFWGDILLTGWNFVLKIFADIEPGAWEVMLDNYVKAGFMSSDQAAQFYKLKDVMSPFDLFMYIKMQFKLFSAFSEVPLMAAQSFAGHKQNKDLRPGLPNYRDVIQAAFVAPEKTGEIKELMAKQGITDADIDLLFLSMYTLYPEDRIRDLYLRKVINEDQMFMRMREIGYTDTRTKELIQSWELIPGPADLFHLVAKEAFEPDSIALMGLGDEYPAEQTKWLEMQGINEYWARKYWVAHWDQPSIGQGFEMLHRDVITLKELDTLFKTTEIPPYWRDKLTKIAFLPYSRVDTRRMHQMNVLGDDELIKAYKDQGYDQEHAENMAEFTILYNQQTDKDITKSQIMLSYRENILSKEEAILLLGELKYTVDKAEFVIALEDFTIAREYQEDIVKNVSDRFKANMIDEPEARKLLNELDLPSQRIDILIDKLEIQRIKDNKFPSKTDLEKMLKQKIITADEYQLEMKKLGYGFKYTNWFQQMATGKIK